MHVQNVLVELLAEQKKHAELRIGSLPLLLQLYIWLVTIFSRLLYLSPTIPFLSYLVECLLKFGRLCVSLTLEFDPLGLLLLFQMSDLFSQLLVEFLASRQSCLELLYLLLQLFDMCFKLRDLISNSLASPQLPSTLHTHTPPSPSPLSLSPSPLSPSLPHLNTFFLRESISPKSLLLLRPRLVISASSTLLLSFSPFTSCFSVVFSSVNSRITPSFLVLESVRESLFI